MSQTIEELELAIQQISETLKKPRGNGRGISDLEARLLHEDRKDLRQRIAEMKASQ
jgi:hypothetical protein